MKKTKQVLPRVEQGPRPSLSFTAQRHGKPPKHMADLTRAERRALVADLGIRSSVRIRFRSIILNMIVQIRKR